MLLGSSRPPLLRGTMWSTSQRSQPGGLGLVRLNSDFAFASRLILPCLSRGQLSHLMELRLLLRALRWLLAEEKERDE
jgi:hypothetical protein